MAFIFATETLEALSVTPKLVLGDQEGIPILAGLARKREGEKNTSKRVEGRIHLTYRVTRIECKISTNFLNEGGG